MKKSYSQVIHRPNHESRYLEGRFKKVIHKLFTGYEKKLYTGYTQVTKTLYNDFVWLGSYP